MQCFCTSTIAMPLLSFFSAIKRHQGAPLRVYRKMMSESGSQSVVLYARVCVFVVKYVPVPSV